MRRPRRRTPARRWPACLRLKLAQRIGRVRHMASTLVLLGLIGTIVGFVIALSGRQPGRRHRRRRDRPHGRDPAARHGHGAVQDPGRLGPQCLADGRLPPARGSAPSTSSPTSSSRESAMQPLDDDGGDDGDIVFRDLIMLTLSGFVTVAVLLLPHIGESQGAKAATETAQPPGNVMVEARWPRRRGQPTSICGCRRPGDVPVGYSNKGGAIFNLLRDDLGQRADATGINYEVSYARGIAARRVHGQPAPLPQPSAPARVPVTDRRQRQGRVRGIPPGRSWPPASSSAARARSSPCSASASTPRARWCRAASPACSKPLR